MPHIRHGQSLIYYLQAKSQLYCLLIIFELTTNRRPNKAINIVVVLLSITISYFYYIYKVLNKGSWCDHIEIKIQKRSTLTCSIFIEPIILWYHVIIVTVHCCIANPFTSSHKRWGCVKEIFFHLPFSCERYPLSHWGNPFTGLPQWLVKPLLPLVKYTILDDTVNDWGEGGRVGGVGRPQLTWASFQELIWRGTILTCYIIHGPS